MDSSFIQISFIQNNLLNIQKIKQKLKKEN